VGLARNAMGREIGMNTYKLFMKQGRGFFEPINEIDIRQIISCNPDGTCLWVQMPDYYMEVDCPDRYNMNARFEADGKIINKLFPYSYTGFIDACDWFDEQRATYRFAKLMEEYD